jgi:hypothetical protein
VGARLEALARSPDIEEGLAARVFDPLWLLGRQWQLGEFTGDDSGTPFVCDVAGTAHLFTGWRPAVANAVGAWQPYDASVSTLEVLVESEPAHEVAATALRVEGGRRLRAALVADGRQAAADALRSACPWDEGTSVAPRGVPALLRRRLADGRAVAALARSVAADPQPAARLTALGIASADVASAATHLIQWLSWWEPRVSNVGDGQAFQPPAWNAARLEHVVELAAASAPAPVLKAPAYRSGRFDWSELDRPAEVEALDSAPPGASVPVTARSIPTPAKFGGMPANRFWELEDAAVDFGRVEASALDLGRLLLVQFATVYGNDWSVVPLRLPVASLTVVSKFTVTDVFGETIDLEPCAAADPAWRLFSQGGDDDLAAHSFFLAPALPGSLDGSAIERVDFARDEMANVAWAVEAVVPDGAARPVDRLDAWIADVAGAGDAAGGAGAGAVPRYLVTTDVPSHWFPLTPEPIGTSGSNRLRLTTVARLVGDNLEEVEPVGRLLADHPPAASTERLWLFDEEVPRTGAAVTRSPQLTRSPDGAARIWVGRQAVTGAGGASSGLRWDELDR